MGVTAPFVFFGSVVSARVKNGREEGNPGRFDERANTPSQEAQSF